MMTLWVEVGGSLQAGSEGQVAGGHAGQDGLRCLQGGLCARHGAWPAPPHPSRLVPE